MHFIDGTMRVRFHAEPIIQATELLLQERTPRDVDAVRLDASRSEGRSLRSRTHSAYAPSLLRRHIRPLSTTQLLSNGRYAVMMTAAGSGYSRWGDLAVTRWREDPTRDCWGSYVFLRDVDTRRGVVGGLSTNAAVEPDSYEASFFEDRVEIIQA